MEDVGRSISEIISFPIIGAGAAALKSAADFEQYEKALIAVTGSVDEAGKQLTRLQKIAEAPGIGFDQAVKASLQLQGLGLQANEAEEAIRQVANVVAASGGGAQSFEGAIRQLNQIQAKNRVLQEDINILLENAPTLGNVLQEAFGGKTAEQIRDAGVDGEEFFDTLIKNLANIERVQGGLFNTFENFGIAVRKALADVGQEIDKIVGVQGIVNSITKAINDAVKTFKNLDKETKVAALRFLALAAALGPIVFVTSRAVTVYRGFFSVIASGAKILAATGARLQLLAAGQAATSQVTLKTSKSISGLIGSFRALTLAQQALIALPIAAAIAGAALLFDEYRTNVAAARAEITVLDNAQTTALKTVASEAGELEALKAQLKDTSISRGEQARAIQRLKDINPGYFADLDTETSKYEDVADAIDSYIQKISLQAEAKQLASELGRVSLALNNNAFFAEEAEKNVSSLDKVQIGVAGVFSSLTKNFSGLAKTVASESNEAFEVTKTSLTRQQSAIEDRLEEIRRLQEGLSGGNTDAPVSPAPVVSPSVTDGDFKPGRNGINLVTQLAIEGTKRYDKFSTSIGATFKEAKLLDTLDFQSFTPDRFTDFATASEIAEGRVSLLREELRRIDLAAEATGESLTMEGQLDVLKQKLTTTKSFLAETAVEFEGNTEAVAALQAILAQLNIEYEKANKNTTDLSEKFSNFKDLAQQLSEGIENSLTSSFTSFFETIAEGGSDAWGQFQDAFKQAIKNLIVQLLAAIAVAATLAALVSIFAPGLAAKQGLKSFGSLFKFFGSGGSLLDLFPGNASGGIVGPGFPNDTYLTRLSSREAIIPLDRLPSLIERMGGSGSANLTATLRGEDLVLASDRARRKMGR